MKIFLIIIITTLVSSFGTYQVVHYNSAERAQQTVCSESIADSNRLPDSSPVITSTRKPSTTEIQRQDSLPAQVAVQPARSYQEPVTSFHQNIKDPEKVIEKFRAALHSDDGESPVTMMQKRYEAEAVNYEWALDKETELLMLFDGPESAYAFKPLDVSCKSKNCQLIFAAGDEKQNQAMYMDLLKLVTEGNNAFPDQMLSYFSDPASGQLIIYLSEKGVADLVQQ